MTRCPQGAPWAPGSCGSIATLPGSGLRCPRGSHHPFSLSMCLWIRAHTSEVNEGARIASQASQDRQVKPTVSQKHPSGWDSERGIPKRWGLSEPPHTRDAHQCPFVLYLQKTGLKSCLCEKQLRNTNRRAILILGCWASWRMVVVLD